MPAASAEFSVPAVATAPWSEDISEAVQMELALGPLEPGSASAVDIAVIGAGVTGLSAALAAREAGADVLLLEAGASIGEGATGRNAGILSAGINMPLADLPAGSPLGEMWLATTAELLALVKESSQAGALVDATLTGSLSLAERPAAARHLARETKARTALGLRAELWSPAEVAQKTAGRLCTSTVQAALWLPDEGRVQPVTLLAHLARRARARGVRLVGSSRVVEREVMAGQGAFTRWRLQLESGTTIVARGLIVATGPTVAANARIYALAFPADLPDDFPLFWDSAPFTYCDFRPGNGRLGISGGRYGKAGAGRRDAHYHAQLATAARHWLPELVGVEPSHAWAVDLAVAPDMVPRARDLGSRAPGMAIEGLGALGVLPGIVLGRRAGAALARRVASQSRRRATSL